MWPHSHQVGLGLGEEQWRTARRVLGSQWVWEHLEARGVMVSRLEAMRVGISDSGLERWRHHQEGRLEGYRVRGTCPINTWKC